MSRKTTIFIALVVIVAGGYLGARLLGGGRHVPQEFTEARLQGALVAQEIVNLSGESTSDLGEISKLDQEREYTEALNVTLGVISKSQEIRERATALSAEIEKMTKSLSEVRPDAAKELALEAINDRLVLISRLINYSNYLARLAEALRNKFTGKPADHQVTSIIGQINDEIQAINGLNVKAVATMEQFDKLVR